MTEHRNEGLSKIEERLLKTYGELLTAHEVAYLFRYRSTQTLIKANQRGKSPVKLFRIPSRKSLFASTEETAKSLYNMTHQED